MIFLQSALPELVLNPPMNGRIFVRVRIAPADFALATSVKWFTGIDVGKNRNSNMLEFPTKGFLTQALPSKHTKKNTCDNMQVSESRAGNRQAQICAQKYYSMKIKIIGKLLPVKK